LICIAPPSKGLKGSEGKTEATDIDLVVLEDKTLYLFECKHSLPPTGPHEIRDVWEDIEKGTNQLAIAMRILSDPVRRQSYLAGWFPGTKPQDTANLKLVPCVLCSDRIFSGLEHQGFPIRDFSSLQLLFQGGIVGMGGPVSEDEVVMMQYRVIRQKEMSGSDLADYCSPESTFFKMFKPFMSPVSRIQRLEGITIAEETFVYQAEVGAVGIEPTTSSMPWKHAPSCATGPRLKTKSPRPPNRDRGKYRIHFRRWHSTPTRHFTSQVPRLGFQQSA
jgi:hypothetical protein